MNHMKQQALPGMESSEQIQKGIEQNILAQLNRIADKFHEYGRAQYIGKDITVEQSHQIWEECLKLNQGDLRNWEIYAQKCAKELNDSRAGTVPEIKEKKGSLSLEIDSMNGGTFTCNFEFRNVLSVLNDFKKELAINWKTTTYSQNDNYKLVQVSLNHRTTLPKEPIFKGEISPYDFSSLEEFMNYEEHIAARQNLETAQKSLAAEIEHNSKYKKHASNVKKYQNMIAYWQKHVDKWNELTKEAQRIDWVEQAIQKEVEANMDLEALYTQKSTIINSGKYINKRAAYDLFKKYSVEITDDLMVLEVLYMADEINNQYGGLRPKPADENAFDSLLTKYEDKYKGYKTAFDKEYRKKDGGFKSIPWRSSKADRRERSEKELEDINCKISFLKTHKKTILEFVND